MYLARKNNDGSIDLIDCSRQEGERMAELRNTGFLDFVPSQQPQVEPGKMAVDTFNIVDGKVVQSWSIQSDPEAVNAEIEALKATLNESDYKVLKCNEAKMVGEPFPYDIDKLHAERQAIRDKINVLQAELATNG